MTQYPIPLYIHARGPKLTEFDRRQKYWLAVCHKYFMPKFSHSRVTCVTWRQCQAITDRRNYLCCNSAVGSLVATRDQFCAIHLKMAVKLAEMVRDGLT